MGAHRLLNEEWWVNENIYNSAGVDRTWPPPPYDLAYPEYALGAFSKCRHGLCRFTSHDLTIFLLAIKMSRFV
jgi:hypothetical protein